MTEREREREREKRFDIFKKRIMSYIIDKTI